jgi:hypothetical protein
MVKKKKEKKKKKRKTEEEGVGFQPSSFGLLGMGLFQPKPNPVKKKKT